MFCLLCSVVLWLHFNRLVQERYNSSALPMELHLCNSSALPMELHLRNSIALSMELYLCNSSALAMQLHLHNSSALAMQLHLHNSSALAMELHLHNSSALAMELNLPCTNPSICSFKRFHVTDLPIFYRAASLAPGKSNIAPMSVNPEGYMENWLTTLLWHHNGHDGVSNH